MTRAEIIAWLKDNVSAERLVHTLGAEDFAIELAHLHGQNEQQASLAALLHDCAKGLSLQDQQQLAMEYGGVDVKDWPRLWHAQAGAILAQRVFGVTDESVIRAIAMHAPAQCGWDMLGKIIYLADHLEKGRQFDGVEALREVAKHDIMEGVIQVINNDLAFLQKQGKEVHPQLLLAQKTYLKGMSTCKNPKN